MCGNGSIIAYPAAFVKGFLPIFTGIRRFHPREKEIAPFASETAGKPPVLEGERRRHQGDKRAGIKEELFRLGVKGIRFTVILPGFGQKGLISPLFHLPKGGGHLQCPAGAGEVRREGKDRAVVIPRLDPLHQLRLRQRLDREVEAEVPLPELGHIRKEAGKFLVLRQEDGQTLGLVSGGAGAVEGGINGKFRQFNCPQPFPQSGREGGFRPGDRFREVGGEGMPGPLRSKRAAPTG